MDDGGKRRGGLGMAMAFGLFSNNGVWDRPGRIIWFGPRPRRMDFATVGMGYAGTSSRISRDTHNENDTNIDRRTRTGVGEGLARMGKAK